MGSARFSFVPVCLESFSMTTPIGTVGRFGTSDFGNGTPGCPDRSTPPAHGLLTCIDPTVGLVIGKRTCDESSVLASTRTLWVLPATPPLGDVWPKDVELCPAISQFVILLTTGILNHNIYQNMSDIF